MVYFISDVHLGLGNSDEQKHREQKFIQLLNKISTDCEHLFLVGDIFDYWFEYKTALPRQFFRSISALDHLVQKGIPVDYLVGNHDFGHVDFWEKEIGVRLHWNDLQVQLAQKRFYIAHGDGKAYNDTGYLLLRAILRNKFILKTYLTLHPNLGIGLASATSHTSREYTEEKDYSQRDGLRDFAEKKICEENFDYVIMGHRHKREITDFGKGTYINIGHWLGSTPTIVSFDGTTCRHRLVQEVIDS